MKRIFTLVMLLWLAMSSAGMYAGNFRLYVDDPSKVDLIVFVQLYL